MNIVFFDIDGTLAKGTEIPSSAVNALHQLRLNGSIIFICTGRPYHYAYRHFYRYANGFVTNNGRYAHMGCCEVMVDEPLQNMPILHSSADKRIMTMATEPRKYA